MSDVVVDALVDVLTGAIMVFVPGIGVEVLADTNVNVITSLINALEFAVPKPFGCLPLAVFNCDRVLQARMPSYHV